jgi:hypothetical protein
MLGALVMVMRCYYLVMLLPGNMSIALKLVRPLSLVMVGYISRM